MSEDVKYGFIFVTSISNNNMSWMWTIFEHLYSMWESWRTTCFKVIHEKSKFKKFKKYWNNGTPIYMSILYKN